METRTRGISRAGAPSRHRFRSRTPPKQYTFGAAQHQRSRRDRHPINIQLAQHGQDLASKTHPHARPRSSSPHSFRARTASTLDSRRSRGARLDADVPAGLHGREWHGVRAARAAHVARRVSDPLLHVGRDAAGASSRAFGFSRARRVSVGVLGGRGGHISALPRLHASSAHAAAAIATACADAAAAC